MSATECQEEPPSRSSLLYQNVDSGITVLDIPASLEESQVLPGTAPERRIYSSPAPDAPFETPEPKHAPYFGFSGGVAGDAQSPAAQIAMLMTIEKIRSAVQHVQDQYTGPLCLPRIVPPAEPPPPYGDEILLPRDSHYLHGSIQDLKGKFSSNAPQFNLIILDPPWPNRSARRKSKGYKTAPTLSDMCSILQDVPITSHLCPGGLVAVWITNKPSIVELLTSRGGLFEQWGLQLAAEWTWVKMTASGEPLFDVDSSWRKPWETLLIAKKIGSKEPRVPNKMILAVPDVHSRKPGLRAMFQPILGQGYKGLEVFARNLTAGWWSWGDEVLKFQSSRYWEAQLSN